MTMICHFFCRPAFGTVRTGLEEAPEDRTESGLTPIFFLAYGGFGMRLMRIFRGRRRASSPESQRSGAESAIVGHRSGRKRVSLCAVLALVVVSGCTDTEFYDLDGGLRLFGDDRYATSAGVVTGFCAAECPAEIDLVVTTGANFPDGLTAASLGSAVLTTKPDVLPGPMVELLQNLTKAQTACGPDQLGFQCVAGHTIGTISLIGGTSAVSTEVEVALREFGTVVRIQGDNRYETALQVAAKVTLGVPKTAIITTGGNFPDALAAGPLSLCANAPILLNTPKAGLRSDVQKFITDNGIAKVYVIGGTAVVSPDVDSTLTGLGVTVQRLAGESRAGTAVKIAEEIAAPSGCNLAPVGVVLVNCDGFADALSAGPLASKARSPILCAKKTGLPTETSDYLKDFETVTGTYTPIIAIGGPNVITATVVQEATDAVNPGFTSDDEVGPGIFLATQSTTEPVPGTTELTIVTVFNDVQVAPTPTVDVFASASALSPIGLTADSSTLSTVNGEMKVLTNVYTVTDPLMLPVIGTAEVRIAVGDVTDTAGLANKRVRKATIISCTPTDLMYRACETLGVGTAAPVVDTIKPVATVDVLIHERFFTVTYSEPVTAATALDPNNYVIDSGVYYSNGASFPYPISPIDVTLVGNTATITLSRPIEDQDRFSVKGEVIADLATPANLAGATGRFSPRDPGFDARLGSNQNGSLRVANYETSWFFVIPAGATAADQCVFTIAVTRGGTEVQETEMAPYTFGGCTTSHPFLGTETLVRAVSLTFNGLQMTTGSFKPGIPPF
jgi:putative cell wall-binding protein